jgi:hypothetical protein
VFRPGVAILVAYNLGFALAKVVLYSVQLTGLVQCSVRSLYMALLVVSSMLESNIICIFKSGPRRSKLKKGGDIKHKED